MEGGYLLSGATPPHPLATFSEKVSIFSRGLRPPSSAPIEKGYVFSCRGAAPLPRSSATTDSGTQELRNLGSHRLLVVLQEGVHDARGVGCRQQGPVDGEVID